jgi:DNA-binding winged helix-turn-helix (wHTH) protein
VNIVASRTHEAARPAELFRLDRIHSRHHLEVVRNATDAQVDHSLASESPRINNNSAATAILFGPFRLLPAKRLLLEGNEPVRIGSRALEILIALVEHDGELLSKNALMERVWPDTTVVEANLSVHIAALRRALRDGSDGNRYLVNMPGRGYRFVAPITLAEDREPSPPIESATRPLRDLPKLLTPLIGRDGNLKELTEQLPQWRLLIVAATIVAAELLKGASGVQVLATSREPLRAEAEHAHRLSQLTSPMASSGLTAAQPLSLFAVQLFVERVKASMGEFELEDAGAPIIADI